MKKHLYRPEIVWTGNLGKGTHSYAGYSRNHEISVPGVSKTAPIKGTADPAFRGDQSRWNPEELFVSSLSACHMLWYLHLCADAGVTVVSYRDEPEGTMELDRSGTGRFTSVVLRPRVGITPESDADEAHELHETAHSRCFLAASVSCSLTVEPMILTEGRRSHFRSTTSDGEPL